MNLVRSLVAFAKRLHVHAGITAAAAAVAEANQPSLLPRPRTDQAIVVAGAFASGYTAGSAAWQAVARLPLPRPGGRGSSSKPVRRRLAVRAVRPALAAAFAAASYAYLRDRLDRYSEDGRTPPPPGDVAWTLAAGTGAAATLGAAVMAERLAARGAATLLSSKAGGPRAVWLPVAHAALGGAAFAGARTGLRTVLGKIETSNRRVEIRYSRPPATSTVSGGAGSVVSFDDLGLQGRRFVSEATPADRIEAVMGETGAKEPVRVYVGVASADTVEERVALAVEDLRRTGGFDRSLLIVGSPAGTGYFNPIPIEAAEYLARGDVASVAVQYGTLPSMLSMSKVPLAVEQHAALLRAVRDGIDTMPPGERPRVVLYGESLGAQTSQGAFVGRGTRILDAFGVDRALWAGTPYAARWRREIETGGPDVDPAVFGVFNSIDAYRALPENERSRIRFFFLDHDEDPVTRFGLDLAYRRPTWLGDPADRPATVSKTQRWVPAVTFFQTAIDTKNAATVVPGEFKALGHDYRADLAEFVAAAYGLTDATTNQMASVEARLRRSEIERAAKIAEG